MRYFFYNTDVVSLCGANVPRYATLIDGGFAAAGGPRLYGERFSKLAVGDVLLMYENGVGVVALGTIVAPWDGKAHTTPRYYSKEELGGQTPVEYRVAVDWFCDLRDQPVTIAELRRRLAVPRRSLLPILKHHDEAERLVHEILRRNGCRDAGRLRDSDRSEGRDDLR